MKKVISLLISVLIISFSWAQISDSFDDGDFINNPTWTGNTDDFIVNSNNELQLYNDNSGNPIYSYLATEHHLSSLNDVEWRFKIKYDFSPSNQNFGLTYLTATDADLSTNPDGIYFRIGENGNDDPIELMERSGGTETTILTSTAGIVAAFNDFINVKIIYNNTGEWELYVDLNGGEAFVLDQSVNYPTSVLGDYLGISLRYTSSNNKSFYYDDIYAGPIQIDNEAPNLVSANPLSNNTLEVLFNEGIDPISGEEVNNYTVSDGIGNPTLVQQDGSNPAKFTLQFASTFTVGQAYTLTVENVEDIAGNAMIAETESFTYMEADVPVFGDIIINEFMARPNPPQNLPNQEYVELYNRSDKYFNLNGWKLKNNTASSNGTIQEVWIAPGEYLLLVKTTALADYPNAIGVTSWAALKDGGDEIHLLTDDGILVDELTYTPDWYQDNTKKNGGWSIERINPHTPCSSADNWRASEDPNGGTPGAQNSVYDSSPSGTIPEVIASEMTLPNQLTLTFSKQVDSLSLENAVFTSQPSLTIANRSVATAYSSEITLTFNENFADGILYEYTFGDFEDCNGNTNHYEGSFAIPQEPELGDIIINEFMPKPSPPFNLPEIQYVELYNRSDKYFYLKDWLLGDNNSWGKIKGGWLFPGEYLILVPNGGSAEYPEAIEVTSWAQLNITGDEIHLATQDTTIVDELKYTDAWYKNDLKKGGGWSIERINPDIPCSNSDNWAASNHANGGTPGLKNSIYDNTPDTEIPTVIHSFAELPNLLTITFSESMDAFSLQNINFYSQQGLSIDSIITEGAFPNEMTIVFNENLESGIIYKFEISLFSDCSGNAGEYEGEFVLPKEGEKGDLIINEILFNPYTGGSDFVELYNTSNKYININNWEFANIKNGEIANIKTIQENYIVAPKDYVVLTNDPNFLVINYPVAVPSKFVKFALPAYNNDSSTVILLYNDSVMDKVAYSDKWHFDLLQSKKGVSLERISSDLPSNSPDNWHSASETIGYATPGRKNSQYLKPEGEGTLSLSSKTFSPDDDGFEDVLLLTYEVDGPDLVGNMTVYDDKGRKVKVLMDNHLLGVEGTIKWDGITEDGNKAAIGPHIILFEIFNLNNAKLQTIKKVVTVAGRL